MAFNLTFALVQESDTGDIDVLASLASAEEAITKYKAERETELTTIANVVNAVFDERPSVNKSMDFVTHDALRRLNVLPGAHKVMKEKILAYLRDNADRHQKKDKAGNIIQEAEKPRTRLFKIGKGVGGGIRRWSDVPEDAPESK